MPFIQVYELTSSVNSSCHFVYLNGALSHKNNIYIRKVFFWIYKQDILSKAISKNGQLCKSQLSKKKKKNFTYFFSLH